MGTLSQIIHQLAMKKWQHNSEERWGKNWQIQIMRLQRLRKAGITIFITYLVDVECVLCGVINEELFWVGNIGIDGGWKIRELKGCKIDVSCRILNDHLECFVCVYFWDMNVCKWLFSHCSEALSTYSTLHEIEKCTAWGVHPLSLEIVQFVY